MMCMFIGGMNGFQGKSFVFCDREYVNKIYQFQIQYLQQVVNYSYLVFSFPIISWVM